MRWRCRVSARRGSSPASLASGRCCELWRYIRRTNVELARFVEAVRLGDLSQSFSHGAEGSGFGEHRPRARRRDPGAARRTPPAERRRPLLRGGARRRADALAHRSAMTAGSSSPTRRRGACSSATRACGSRIFATMATPSPRARRGGGRPAAAGAADARRVPQAAVVSAAAVHRLGGMVRVVAVQPIQSELNAVEIAAQSDLVRVLTHEIMNSMTPVTSLAQQRRRPDGGSRSAATTRRWPMRAPRSRRWRGAPTESCISSKAIARSAAAARCAAAASTPCLVARADALFRASDSSAGVTLDIDVAPRAARHRRRSRPALPGADQPPAQRRGGRARPWRRRPQVALAFAAVAGGRVPHRGRRQRPRRSGDLAPGGVPAFLHHQGEGHRRRPQPRPPDHPRPGGSISLAESESGGALFRIVL